MRMLPIGVPSRSSGVGKNGPCYPSLNHSELQGTRCRLCRQVVNVDRLASINSSTGHTRAIHGRSGLYRHGPGHWSEMSDQPKDLTIEHDGSWHRLAPHSRAAFSATTSSTG